MAHIVPKQYIIAITVHSCVVNVRSFDGNCDAPLHTDLKVLRLWEQVK